jgi:exopolyphosphatase / guanosine-5'-triphosphate,3'-diphosphate pyrophosphatase
MVATSATRDAANREEFVRAVVDVLGIAPEVVSGAEEAALSFAGATAGVAGSHPGSYLVADIGGGSTEIVLGDPLTGVTAARSVDVGCVRLTERCLRSDPPTATEVEAAEGVVEAALDLVDETLDARSAATFVGLAGSVTTVAAIALGLPRYDPVAIHGRRIAREDVERVTADLLRASRSERAAAPVMHPGRVDVIGGGALVLRSLLRRYDLPAVVASESDILDGIALSLAR